MMPRTLTVLDDLPLSANGKVDRGKLQQLVTGRARQAGGGGPATDLERAVAEVVAAVMQQPDCPPDRALFDMGATSLTMVELRRSLRQTYRRAVPTNERITDTHSRGGTTEQRRGGKGGG